jgi:hypothetical protein
MREYEIASEMYSYFYRKYTQGAFGLSESNENKALVRNFLKRVKDDKFTIGINWLFDYVAYQFHYCMKSNYKQIYPAFIFGKKSYDRWKLRKVKVLYPIERDFLQSRHIVKSVAIRAILEDVIGIDYQGLDISKADENVKKNYKRNLFSCLFLTSLYNPMSGHCAICNHQELCRKHLQNRNYELYNKRMKVYEPNKQLLARASEA